MRDFEHFQIAAPGGKGKAEKIKFFLSEPEDLPRAFNVLYVRTQRPSFLRLPLVRLLADTWAETVELLRPLRRLGIPETSLKDKCPYWRDDDNMPATPSFRTQRLYKAIRTEGFGTFRSVNPAVAAYSPGPRAHDSHGQGPFGELFGKVGHKAKHLTAFQQKEELVEAVTPWVVLGINVMAWCYLGGNTVGRPLQ